jgi:hypothetical protein
MEDTLEAALGRDEQLAESSLRELKPTASPDSRRSPKEAEEFDVDADAWTDLTQQLAEQIPPAWFLLETGSGSSRQPTWAELTQQLARAVPRGWSPRDVRRGALSQAEALAQRLLGTSATVSLPLTDSGIYQGEIIADTSDYVIQRVSKLSAIAHPKRLLEEVPEVGQTVRILYSNDSVLIRELGPHSHSRERSR